MMAAKTSKSSPVVAAVVRSTIRGLGRLSLPNARRLGRGIGALLWRVPNQFRDASLRNVRRCFPELGEEDQRRIVRVSLISTGLNVVEAGAMFHGSAEQLQELEEEVVGSDILDAAVARGRGVLALGPHLGNWEYLSHAIARGWGLVGLYRPPRIAELDTYLRQSRERLGTEMLPATGSGLRRLVRVLKEGGVVGILPDQEPLKGAGVFAPFFGVSALTMTLVGSLVRRFDAAVVIGWAERTESGRFRIHIEKGPAGLGDPDPVRAATRLNLGVEQCVRKTPEQYTWSYRRFRTRPGEELAARAAGSDSTGPTTAAG